MNNMRKIHFTKMHGAANDFVLIDDREGTLPLQSQLLAALATRRTGIGCEGVILVQKSEIADFRMRFFNPDGTEVELCGNGSRCVAAFAKKIGAVRSSAMTIETIAGLVDAEVISQDQVRIWMPEPTDRRYSLQVHVEDRVVIGDFVRVGVPHFVVQVPSVAKVDVMKEGRALRLSDAFAPNGTNVDFVQIVSPSKIMIRTYERGVEAESGACGTGAVASAVVAVEKMKSSLPMQVRTVHGFNLAVDGDYRQSRSTGITLTGPVHTVYEGDLDLDSLDLQNGMR
jgi:diaminopimelate epimerase